MKNFADTKLLLSHEKFHEGNLKQRNILQKCRLYSLPWKLIL